MAVTTRETSPSVTDLVERGPIPTLALTFLTRTVEPQLPIGDQLPPCHRDFLACRHHVEACHRHHVVCHHHAAARQGAVRTDSALFVCLAPAQAAPHSPVHPKGRR